MITIVMEKNEFVRHSLEMVMIKFHQTTFSPPYCYITIYHFLFILFKLRIKYFFLNLCYLYNAHWCSVVTSEKVFRNIVTPPFGRCLGGQFSDYPDLRRPPLDGRHTR